VRADHEHRPGDARGADAAAELQAWEHPVEDDEVIAGVGGESQAQAGDPSRITSAVCRSSINRRLIRAANRLSSSTTRMCIWHLLISSDEWLVQNQES
jgi:hypothetical protein